MAAARRSGAVWCALWAAALAASAAAAVAAAASAVPAAAVTNNRPVIGVLTLPCADPAFCGNATSYFPASYVKWLESGGAQVVPVHYDAPADQLLALLGQLNGLLYTGGGVDLVNGNPYLEAAELAYNHAAALNAAGDYFPLWGTCMGFQTIIISQANDPGVLQVGAFDSENLTLPLDYTPLAASSMIFDASRPGASAAMQVMGSEAVTMNNHHDGITPDRFAATPALASFFDVLATNLDRNGTEFVSLIEGKSGYVFASQFHPEKPQYEWTPTEVTAHSADAVSSMQYLAQFFVDMARGSSHQFPSFQALSEALIYNSPTTFTNGEFTECYFWTAPAARAAPSE